LLRPQGLPAFDRIAAPPVGPAIDVLLGAVGAAQELAVGHDVPADYDELATVLGVPVERLGRAWAVVTHLNEAADTPALRTA
jgi:oligopeptidase A